MGRTDSKLIVKGEESPIKIVKFKGGIGNQLFQFAFY